MYSNFLLLHLHFFGIDYLIVANGIMAGGICPQPYFSLSQKFLLRNFFSKVQNLGWIEYPIHHFGVS